MRSFVWFFGLFILGFVGMATLSYPAWLLLHPAFDFPFHRMASRIGMLTLAIGFFAVSRHLGLANKASLGYGAPRRVFIREMLIGLGLGVAMMLPVVIAMVALDLRDLKEDISLNAALLSKLLFVGLLRGFAVAFIEETFLRGAMFTSMSRESGPRVAIIATALIYSATHFFQRTKIPADQVTPESGFVLVSGILQHFGNPLFIYDAFISLAAVGVLLAMVRWLTGNIAACIGLHAGWVWMITFVIETSRTDRSHPLAFLISEQQGFVGWLVLAWTLVMGWVLYRFYSKRSLIPQPAG